MIPKYINTLFIIGVNNRRMEKAQRNSAHQHHLKIKDIIKGIWICSMTSFVAK